MSLEELTKRATITFPILATVEDMERLFGYFHQEAGLITDYTLEICKRIGNEFEEQREQEAAITKDYQLDGSVSVPSLGIKDTLRNITGGTSERWDFHCYKQIAGDDSPYFSGMRFFTTPGWSLGDYRPGTLQLWDQVRELTNKYFELRKPGAEE